MTMDYHGVLFDTELDNPALVHKYPIFAVAVDRERPRIAYGVSVPSGQIYRSIREVQQNLRCEGTGHVNFYNEREVITIFKDRVFLATPDPSSWAPVLEYGNERGVPLDGHHFKPCTLEQEAAYFSQDAYRYELYAS
jgi:hypothetical protein